MTLWSGSAGAADQFTECADRLQDLEGVSLDEAWETGRDVEPDLLAPRRRADAAEAELDETERTLLPDIEFGAEGDVGKRVSPGAERDQGFSARTSVGARTSALLFDDARRYRTEQRRRLVDAQEASIRAVDAEFRTDLAIAYLEAEVAEARHRRLVEQRAHFKELEEIVDRRIDAGVEGEYASTVLDEALSRHERRLTDARSRLEEAVVELSFRADRCVVASPVDVDLDRIDADTAPELDRRVDELRRRARAAESGADVTDREGAFELRAVGDGGLYFSPAYDNVPEPEYFAGFTWLWHPDLRGTRSRRADADRQRARALEAEADGLERQIRRDRQRFKQFRSRYDDRHRQVDDQLRQARRRTETAVRRWQEGVDDWREVVDARERLVDAHLEALELREELLRRLAIFARTTDRLDRLPIWLDEDRHE